MKILFSGCSFFYGSHLVDPRTGVANVVAKELNADVTNVANGGNNNDIIFVDALTEMTKNHYDHVFVGFTSWPRWCFFPELDYYPQMWPLSPGKINEWVHTLASNEGFKIKHPQQLHSHLMLLNHDWYNIMQVVKFVNILATYPNVTFVNTLCHWDSGFFEQFKILKGKTVLPSTLTPYTQKLLNVDNREDTQINQLLQVNMISEFDKIGHIHADRWLNLYNPWSQNRIDFATDNIHPGEKSHKWMADSIIKFIDT